MIVTTNRRLERAPTRHGRHVAGTVAAAAVAVLCVAVCGSSSAQTQTTETTFTFDGHLVSKQARMVCEPEAISDLARDLAVKTVATPTPGWSNGSYTCTYRYPGGASFVLSVRDLRSTAAAGTYLKGLAATLGRTDQPINLGTEAAFITPTGTAVVQKDHHVLVVDVSGLPPTWLTPPESHSVAAQTIAATIMGCWMGGS